MNLLNLCLRIPNLGILLFYLFFIILIPYILVANSNLQILKFYMPLMVAFAHLLTLSKNDKLFGNLYDLKPDNFVSFLSTNFINLFALFGILWQVISYTSNDTTHMTYGVIYGIILFVIVFPMARQGLKFVVDNVDLYMRKKTELTFEYNWHILAFGLLYIIFLLGLQAVLLSLVDTTKKSSETDMMKRELKKYKQNKQMLQNERAKLLAQMENSKIAKNKAEQDLLEMKLKNTENDEEKINNLIENIRENVNNDQLNEFEYLNEENKGNNKNENLTEAKKMLNKITLSDLESFAKKQGIQV